MADCEYEEENLDDFMINASLIISQESNPEKETMIESLKQHLSSIFDNKSEMQSFFKTLNNVIFNKNANKIVHKQPFKLYPLIFFFLLLILFLFFSLLEFFFVPFLLFYLFLLPLIFFLLVLSFF